MQIYWSHNSIPELKPFDKSERSRLWQAGYARCFRKPLFWLAMISVGVFGALGSAAGQALSESRLAAYIGVAIGSAIGGIIYFQVAVYYARRHIAAHLHEGESL